MINEYPRLLLEIYPLTQYALGIKGNVANLNGRIYNQEAIDKILTEFLKKDHPMYGELGYGESTVVALTKVSHIIVGMEKFKNDLYVEFETLDTPSGKIAKKLLLENMLCIRPRTIGIVNSDGTVNIDQLISFDLIPKSEDAFT